MIRRHLKKLIITGMFIALLVSCSETPTLKVNLSDKYNDSKIELVSLLDSTIIASSVIENGAAVLTSENEMPLFTSVLIDGRVRAFYISEGGEAFLNDSISSAYGTPLNNRFSELMVKLDSVEQYDDMQMYIDFVEDVYNENKVNPIGSYFGIEWLKYAAPEKVDSMLNEAPLSLRDSPKTSYYKNFAQLRAKTSAGQKFLDIEGTDQQGNPLNLSDLVKPGQYTLVDFWASWCPYCIKELPEIAEFYETWKDKGVEVVGIAVRDLQEDTDGAISKHNISWPIIYNTQRKAYDIYGFSGIPHHILIGPDGIIISREENISKINQRILEALN